MQGQSTKQLHRLFDSQHDFGAALFSTASQKLQKSSRKLTTTDDMKICFLFLQNSGYFSILRVCFMLANVYRDCYIDPVPCKTYIQNSIKRLRHWEIILGPYVNTHFLRTVVCCIKAVNKFFGYPTIIPMYGWSALHAALKHLHFCFILFFVFTGMIIHVKESVAKVYTLYCIVNTEFQEQ